MKKEEKVSAHQYTPEDYDAYREGIKQFTGEKVPFLHFMASKGIIRFDSREGSGFCISSPVEYTRWNNIRAKYEFARDAKLKEILDSMPEEKAAWRARIEEIGKSIRKVAQHKTT